MESGFVCLGDGTWAVVAPKVPKNMEHHMELYWLRWGPNCSSRVPYCVRRVPSVFGGTCLLLERVPAFFGGTCFCFERFQRFLVEHVFVLKSSIVLGWNICLFL